MVEHSSDDRLDSWKEIAAYVRRDVKTAQRWEKREGMPVHRHLHDKMGSVYAFRTELDAWTSNRRPTTPDDGSIREASLRSVQRSRWRWGLAAVGTILAVGLVATVLWPRRDPGNPLENARFLPLTDFNGIEQAATISRDGKLAAFLSDRDGQMDVWVTQIGSGEFHNLTRGAARDIVNPSVRTLGFSPDGTIVTFWARRLDAAQQSETSIWGIPVLGGSPRVYLDGVAEYDWSDDDSHIVYHTSGEGDPTFVRDARDGSTARHLFSAPVGLHSHFPLWSPNRAFLYFIQGSVPNRMDVWRVKPSGGTPERITNHDAVVRYPVFLDPRTLVYLATDRDGSGPWIYSVDVERRLPRRASVGIDRYTSLAASDDGRRLVATVASPKATLWRVPISGEPARIADAHPIPLTTGNGSSPRAGDGFLLYVSSKGASDSIWKRQGESASELWTSPDTRVTGGPVLAPGEQRIAFSTRRNDGQTQLWVADADGRNARAVPTSLELQGAPAWAPTGHALTVAALVDGAPSLFTVPIDGGSPVRLVREHSIDPAWSPDGGIIVFSGADVGTTFPLKAVTAAGEPHRIPELILTRGARRVVFLPASSALVMMRGDLSHKNLWAIDLETGAKRQLTNFAPGFDIRDFDIDRNGREIVVEQVQEHSDIVLLERPR